MSPATAAYFLHVHVECICRRWRLKPTQDPDRQTFTFGAVVWCYGCTPAGRAEKIQMYLGDAAVACVACNAPENTLHTGCKLCLHSNISSFIALRLAGWSWVHLPKTRIPNPRARISYPRQDYRRPFVKVFSGV